MLRNNIHNNDNIQLYQNQYNSYNNLYQQDNYNYLHSNQQNDQNPALFQFQNQNDLSQQLSLSLYTTQASMSLSQEHIEQLISEKPTQRAQNYQQMVQYFKLHNIDYKSKLNEYFCNLYEEHKKLEMEGNNAQKQQIIEKKKESPKRNSKSKRPSIKEEEIFKIYMKPARKSLTRKSLKKEQKNPSIAQRLPPIQEHQRKISLTKKKYKIEEKPKKNLWKQMMSMLQKSKQRKKQLESKQKLSFAQTAKNQQQHNLPSLVKSKIHIKNEDKN